jgi:hypothetical protein
MDSLIALQRVEMMLSVYGPGAEADLCLREVFRENNSKLSVSDFVDNYTVRKHIAELIYNCLNDLAYIELEWWRGHLDPHFDYGKIVRNLIGTALCERRMDHLARAVVRVGLSKYFAMPVGLLSHHRWVEDLRVWDRLCNIAWILRMRDMVRADAIIPGTVDYANLSSMMAKLMALKDRCIMPTVRWVMAGACRNCRRIALGMRMRCTNADAVPVYVSLMPATAPVIRAHQNGSRIRLPPSCDVRR